jgi:hypothetical protein
MSFDFGPLAAQHDASLLSYFHVSEQASKLVDFKRSQPNFIYVARSGAGKTALLKWLESGTSGAAALVIKPAETRLAAGTEALNEADLEVQFGTELFSAVAAEAKERGLGSSQTQAEISSFFTSKWKQKVGRFFTENFGGLSILGCGFTLKGTNRTDYLRELRASRLKAAVQELLRPLASEGRAILVVDDPEQVVGEGLEATSSENGIRVGVFLGVLAELHSLGIRVIVFIKEQVLQNVRAFHDNYQHYSDRIDSLEWRSDDLLAMVEKRVEKRLSTKWDKVFAPSRAAMAGTVFPFLINGPRDLLWVCNLAGRREGRITQEALKRSIKALPSQKWTDMAKQFGKQLPHVDDFARAMIRAIKREHGERTIPNGAIVELFNREFQKPRTEIHSLRKHSWVEGVKWDSPKADELLLIIGCLGYQHEGERYFPWSGRSLDRLRLAESHFVSPLFLAQA